MAKQGTGPDPDSLYVQDCRQVQSSTHAIQTLTGQISRLMGCLQTSRDIAHCRSLVDDAVRQASETRAVLLRVREHERQAATAAEANSRRMMHRKLNDNLAVTVRVLEDIVKRFTAEEQRRPSLEVSLQSMPAVSAADVAGGNEQLVMEASLEDEIEQDRLKALRRVDEEMLCLQRIYADLANSVEQQQASFDSIESHMGTAAGDTELGRREIELMSRHTWSRTLKRKFWMLVGGVVATAAVGAFVFSS